MNEQLKNVARVLFGLPFVIFGVNHFFNAGMLQGVVPGFIPGGIFWVYVTGLVLVLTGVSIVINKWVDIAGYALAALLLVFVLTIHLPGMFSNPMQSMSGLLKDFALMAASFYFASTQTSGELT
ncbi:MAG: DoxX family protein [Candidatus Marinimicrobia bacterium]|nr:DoxX family protein [Candidatus Neomarinimicrobiota bacterium]MCF7828454.1 DoxX family protein [Candidatus Neomarinimicrobiota bacterium]MCF7880952.1 DoxX family protein [Candidatus Neomarinimicrobiota bacterium]